MLSSGPTQNSGYPQCLDNTAKSSGSCLLRTKKAHLNSALLPSSNCTVTRSAGKSARERPSRSKSPTVRPVSASGSGANRRRKSIRAEWRAARGLYEGTFDFRDRVHSCRHEF